MQQNMIDLSKIEKFRNDLRQFERAIEKLNKTSCLCNINVPQCHTIMDIGLTKDLTVKALAEKMNLDKSTVSRQVDKLVKSGLVNRIIPASDRRTVRISLSEKGQEIYQEMSATINEQFLQVFKSIPAADLAVFFKVFKQVAQDL
jgi:DNA-binding MarR family transcriptional regulator